MTRLPIPVINRPNIILSPSIYVVKFIPKEGIHLTVYRNASPLLIEGRKRVSARNKVIGTVSTNHPIWIRGNILYNNGISTAAKNGIIIAIFTVNKIKPPLLKNAWLAIGNQFHPHNNVSLYRTPKSFHNNGRFVHMNT